MKCIVKFTRNKIDKNMNNICTQNFKTSGPIKSSETTNKIVLRHRDRFQEKNNKDKTFSGCYKIQILLHLL